MSSDMKAVEEKLLEVEKPKVAEEYGCGYGGLVAFSTFTSI